MMLVLHVWGLMLVMLQLLLLCCCSCCSCCCCVNHNDNATDNNNGNNISCLRSKSVDNLLSENNSDGHEGDSNRHSGSFEDSSNSPKVVEKTTNMANFYYRQAQSPPSNNSNSNTK
jgi:hypothetical protein